MTSPSLDRGARRALLLVAALTLAVAAAPAQFTADFSADVVAGDNTLTVHFSDETTGGTVAFWSWDFGDGTTKVGQNPTHTYTAPGTYDVSLDVIGQLFQTDSVTKRGFITVEPAPLVVDFSQSATAGSGALEVQFADTSTGAEATGWLWDFGDGGTSTDPNPAHLYLGGGPVAYDVSLTVFVGEQSETLVRPGAVLLGPSRFAEPRFLLAAFQVEVLQPVDADSDGDLDLVASGAVGSTWLTNDGQGGFGPPEELGDWALRLDVADLDGDGQDDLLAVLPDALVWMAQQPGVRPFDLPIPLEPSPFPFFGALGVGDVDGDGHPDPAFSAGTRGASFYPNPAGDARFAEPLLMTGDQDTVSDMELVDLDRDGDLDLVWSSLLDDHVRWSQNLAGDGSAWSQHAIDGADNPRSLAVADLDQDGDDDVLWWDAGGGQGPTVWARNPWPSSAPWTRVVIDDGPVFLGNTLVVTADLDGDGEQDVLNSIQSLSWYEGQIDPGPLHLLDPLNAEAVSTADVDGDGDQDVFALHLLEPSGVMLYENRTDGADWLLTGSGLGGVEGLPTLFGSGALAAGEVVTLALEGAAADAPATLVLGLSALEAPFKGGTLVPFPDLLISLATDGLGRSMLQAPWPAGVPAGLDVFAQLWIVDGAAPAGLSATHGVVGTTTR